MEVPHIDYEKLTDERATEKSGEVRGRVKQAQQTQLGRFRGTKLGGNADMTPAEVKQFCLTEPAAQSLLRAAMKQLHLTARAFHRILKVSRTIADLEGSDIIKTAHLAEALQYRHKEMV